MEPTNRLLTVPEGERRSWAYWLGCTEAIFDQSGLHLIPKQVQGNRLIVLVTKIGAIISIPELTFPYCERMLLPLGDQLPVTMAAVANALGDGVQRLGNILWQAALEPGDLPIPVDRAVRKLAGADLLLLKKLEEACHPTEWTHSCLGYNSSSTYGYIIDDEVVAAAHCVMLHPGLASIGVLTHPQHRGRGYSTAVAHATVTQALEEGHSAHYQTMLENAPSIAVARKLGFKPFGLSRQLHLKAVDE